MFSSPRALALLVLVAGCSGGAGGADTSSRDASSFDASRDAAAIDAGSAPDADPDGGDLDTPPDGGASDGGTPLDCVEGEVFDPHFGCGAHTASARDGDAGWTVYPNGVQVDETLDLAWSPEHATPWTLETDLAAECAADHTAGLTWRAPTVDDLRLSFAGGCPGVDAVSLRDPSCLASACNDVGQCVGLPTGTHYCQDDIPECISWVATTSACADCAGVWTYQSANAIFIAIDTPGLRIRCVADLAAP